MRPFGTVLHPDDQNLVNLRQPTEGLVRLFALGIGSFFHEHISLQIVRFEHLRSRSELVDPCV
jgi:uncharacterized membrane protein